MASFSTVSTESKVNSRTRKGNAIEVNGVEANNITSALAIDFDTAEEDPSHQLQLHLSKSKLW